MNYLNNHKFKTNKMRTEILKVTPKMAIEFLKKNDNNRKVSESVVKRYSYQMKNNEWLLSPDGLSFDFDDNILNGQHRLRAVIMSGMDIKFIVNYEVPKEVFAVIDTGKNRSGSDVLGILKVKNAAVTAACVRKYLMLNNFENTNHIQGGNSYSTITNQHIIAEYNANDLFYGEVVRYAISLYHKMRVYGVSESAAIMSKLIMKNKHNKDDVYSFFKQLFTGNEVSNNAILLLRDRLIKNMYSKVKLTPNAKMMLIKKTWNYYVSGKEPKVLSLDINKEKSLAFK